MIGKRIASLLAGAALAFAVRGVAIAGPYRTRSKRLTDPGRELNKRKTTATVKPPSTEIPRLRHISQNCIILACLVCRRMMCGPSSGTAKPPSNGT